MGFYLGGRDQGAQAWTLEELIPDLVEEQGVRRPEGTLSWSSWPSSLHGS